MMASYTINAPPFGSFENLTNTILECSKWRAQFSAEMREVLGGRHGVSQARF